MDFEQIILDFIDGIGNFDFRILIYFLIFTVVLLWFFVVFWVWTDSGDRSTSIIFRLISVILVLPFNLFGLIIYFIIRPKDTIESLFWTDLERRYLINETADLGDCNNCGYQLSPQFNQCPQCATPVRVECDDCGEMVRTDWKYCAICGNQMLKRRVREQELTQEIMEKNLEETRVQAVAAVESNKIRYRSRKSVLVKIGTPVLVFGKKIDDSLKKMFGSLSTKSKKVKRKAKSKRNPVDNTNENKNNSSDKVQPKTTVNSKQQKKRKRKKKKSKK
jgi:RNA polymerase subunit RPABC4/transcription elongation factor Spt4